MAGRFDDNPFWRDQKLVAVHAFWRDTLETMTECFSAFLRASARKLWNAIKLEGHTTPFLSFSFQPTDGAAEEAALATMQALVVTIHADDAQDEDVQGLGFVDVVLKVNAVRAQGDRRTCSGERCDDDDPEERVEDSNELPTRERTSAHVLSVLCGPPPCLRIETLVEALTPRLTTITLPSPSSFSSSDGGGEEDPELSALLALCTLRPAAFIRDARGGADTRLPAVSIACLRLRRLLAAIKRALAGKVDEGHADADSLVPVLYGLCVHAALHDGGGPATDPRVVGVVDDIIVLVVQSLAPTRQQAFAAVLVPAFLEGKIVLLCSGEHVIYVGDIVLPFTVSPFHPPFGSNTHTDDDSDFQAEATASKRNPLILFEARYIHRRVAHSFRLPYHSSASLYLGDARRNADINACTESILLRASPTRITSAGISHRASGLDRE
ncbi:hypothetical protein B0H13DRAFT_2325291 [Mycena leptocephala]|nr:hypothetical protein B0H13DRAFT_2325291 [Mycena leptocephala]